MQLPLARKLPGLFLSKLFFEQELIFVYLTWFQYAFSATRCTRNYESLIEPWQ